MLVESLQVPVEMYGSIQYGDCLGKDMGLNACKNNI
jgi:hypothetical protein